MRRSYKYRIYPKRVVNVRQDFQHKLANQIIRENDIIILEDLNIKKLLEKEDSYRNLKSGIQDAAWGNFVSLLLYKAESAGKEIRQIDPRNTSKMCSCCGKINKNLKLTDRIFHCDFCGFEMDRDRNSAINIKKLGMSFADIKQDIFRSLRL